MTLLDELFKIAVEKGASDLHIIVGKPPILRIRGDLMPIKDTPVVGSELSKRMIASLLSKERYNTFVNDNKQDILSICQIITNTCEPRKKEKKEIIKI